MVDCDGRIVCRDVGRFDILSLSCVFATQVMLMLDVRCRVSRVGHAIWEESGGTRPLPW